MVEKSLAMDSNYCMQCYTSSCYDPDHKLLTKADDTISDFADVLWHLKLKPWDGKDDKALTEKFVKIGLVHGL